MPCLVLKRQAVDIPGSAQDWDYDWRAMNGPVITARPGGSLRKLSPARSLVPGTSKAPCDDRCPEVAACDGLLTAIRPGRVSSALDTTISHVPGRQ